MNVGKKRNHHGDDAEKPKTRKPKAEIPFLLGFRL